MALEKRKDLAAGIKRRIFPFPFFEGKTKGTRLQTSFTIPEACVISPHLLFTVKIGGGGREQNAAQKLTFLGIFRHANYKTLS